MSTSVRILFLCYTLTFTCGRGRYAPQLNFKTKDPAPAESLFFLGTLRIRGGRSEDSVTEGVAGAERIRHDGDLLFAQRKYSMAVKLYTEALKQNPSLIAVLASRGAANLALGRFQEAATDCLTFIDDPNNHMCMPERICAAKALLGLGRSEQARIQFAIVSEEVHIMLEFLYLNNHHVQGKELWAGMGKGKHTRCFENGKGRNKKCTGTD